MTDDLKLPQKSEIPPEKESKEKAELPPDYEPPEYEYPPILAVDAYRNWVLGKPFKDSIAKMDTSGIISYINGITKQLKNAPVNEEAKRFWDGYKAALLGKEKLADDEIFCLGYDAALGIVKPPKPKRKVKPANPDENKKDG